MEPWPIAFWSLLHCVLLSQKFRMCQLHQEGRAISLLVVTQAEDSVLLVYHPPMPRRWRASDEEAGEA